MSHGSYIATKLSEPEYSERLTRYRRKFTRTSFAVIGLAAAMVGWGYLGGHFGGTEAVVIFINLFLTIALVAWAAWAFLAKPHFRRKFTT